MGVQRSIAGALARMGGPDAIAGQPFAVSPWISFVVPLGSDRPDAERPVFVANFIIAGAAGVFGALALQSNGGVGPIHSVEMVAAWCARSGGGLDVGWGFTGPLAPASASLNTTSTDGSVATALAVPLGNVGLIPSASIVGVQNETIFLPVSGFIFGSARGTRTLVIESFNVNTELRGGFAWRELEAGDS